MANGPRAEGIHHAVRAAQERRNARRKVEVFHALKVFFCIDGLDIYLFRSFPVGSDAVFLLPFLSVFGFDVGVDIYVVECFSCHNLYSQFSVKLFECLELVHTHMDKVLNAGGLEVVATCRCSGNDEQRAVAYSLKGRYAILCILVVA